MQYFMKVGECMNSMFPIDRLPTHDESALSSILDEQNVFVQRLIKDEERTSHYIRMNCFNIEIPFRSS